MELSAFLSNLPALHLWSRGWNVGGFDGKSLAHIVNLIDAIPSPRVIETGAGASTLAFLFTKAERAVSICPEGPLFRRIKEYASKNGLATDRLTCIEGLSEMVLPALSADPANTFNFALIDGGHGWPTVFIDFFYINYMLAKGGMLLLDDTNLYTVRELAKLLLFQDTHFVLRGKLNSAAKCLIFEKITDSKKLPDFKDLPYITARNDAFKARTGKDELEQALDRLPA